MKYEIVLTNAFKRQLKIIKRRSKDLNKLKKVVNALAKSKELEDKYRDHLLVSNSRFKTVKNVI